MSKLRVVGVIVTLALESMGFTSFNDSVQRNQEVVIKEESVASEVKLASANSESSFDIRFEYSKYKCRNTNETLYARSVIDWSDCELKAYEIKTLDEIALYQGFTEYEIVSDFIYESPISGITFDTFVVDFNEGSRWIVYSTEEGAYALKGIDVMQ